jgi:exopolysaccharide biosynthesis polyprenyl glycosylphosphotransferase
LNPSKRNFLLGALKIFNLGLMVLSFGLATVLLVSEAHGDTSLSDFLSMRVKLSNFVVFSAMLIAWHGIFSICGLYQSKRLATQSSLIIDAGKATTLATLYLVAVAEVFRITMVTPEFISLFWILSSALVILARVAIRYLLGKIRRHGRNLRYMLILGTNLRAIALARKVEAKPELGYRVLGFVDGDWPGSHDFLRTGYQLCCNFDNLPEYLRRNIVDEVAIYLPLRSFHEHTSQVAALCEQHGIIMRFDSDMFNLKIARSRAEDFEGDPHIAVYSGSSDVWPMLAKRVLDVVVSIVLLVPLTPIFMVVAALIRLTSKGPIFFLQERVGLNKRRFLIYKFRTMIPNAEKMLPELEMLNEAGGPVFKIKNDPRMTPIGKFLRRASIDELTQLFNVLKGDMSLVGPRPLPVRDYEGFNEDWQRRRFSIRPGITCLWQVKGRSSITFKQWMELDIKYLDDWSLWLDFKILLWTIPAVLKGSGAA